jgi:hypothetical protein
MRDSDATARGSLSALVAWAIMAAIWNFAGVWLAAHRHAALA